MIDWSPDSAFKTCLSHSLKLKHEEVVKFKIQQ